MTTSIVLSSLKPRINVRDRFGGLFFAFGGIGTLMLNEVWLRLAGEFLEPGELFLGIVPGVEPYGVGYDGALAFGEGEWRVATCLP